MANPNDSLFDVGASTIHYTKEVASVAATSTFSVMCATTANNLKYRVTRAQLLLDATYAADPANFYVITLVHNGTTVATWSTQTSAQGVLTAFTVNEMVLAADTGNNRVVQPGEVLTLVCTKNGTAANLSARCIVHGRFI